MIEINPKDIQPHRFLSQDAPRPEKRTVLNETEIELWTNENLSEKDLRLDLVAQARENHIRQEQFEMQLVRTINELQKSLSKPFIILLGESYGKSQSWTKTLASPLMNTQAITELFVSEETIDLRLNLIKNKLPDEYYYLLIDDAAYIGTQAWFTSDCIKDAHIKLDLDPPKFIAAIPFIAKQAESQLIESGYEIVSDFQKISSSEALENDPRGMFEIHTSFFDHKVSDTHFLKDKKNTRRNNKVYQFFKNENPPYRNSNIPYAQNERKEYGEYMLAAYSVKELELYLKLAPFVKPNKPLIWGLNLQEEVELVKHVIDVKLEKIKAVGRFLPLLL